MIRDDRPAAKNDEIEITPEMIEAGILALHEFHFGQREDEIVEAIYLHMEIERRSL